MEATMYTDNSTQIMKDIAQFIIDNASEKLSKWDEEKLQKTVSGELNYLDRDFYYIEFKSNVSDDADTNATLYVRKTMMRGGFTPYKEDEEGNQWSVGAITTEVNWPCHGSANVQACKSRLAFYGSIVGLAEAIESKFGDVSVYELVSTKAQRDEEEKARTHEKATRAVIASIENHPVRKHMRVGVVREVHRPIEAPPGTYTVTIKEKTYKVTVYTENNHGVGGNIERIA